MKIELKKIKINLTFSEETTMFQAELAVNGVVIGYANNDGRGGCTEYGILYYDLSPEIIARNRKLLAEAEAYCKTLPSIHSEELDVDFDMDLEGFIDDLVTAELRKKEQKKVEKKMVDTIMWGKPKGNSYMQAKFKIPLAKIPLFKLQEIVDKYKKEFKEGDEFLNTNFEALGVKL